MNDKNLQNWIGQVDEDFREKQRRQIATKRQEVPVNDRTKHEPIEGHWFDPGWFKADCSS